jgi:aerobic carbon-monoxide dehydrogenase large subunit
MTGSVLGQPIKRREDRRLVSGRGRFVDDIAPADMLHCVFLRSPFAHAEIERIDASAARALPGVIDVFAGDDIDIEVETVAFLPGQVTPRQPALAGAEVNYVGEVVAVVLAESRYVAQDALELIEVDYKPLPAITDPEDALETSSPLVHSDLGTNRCFRYPVGGTGVDEGFASAEITLSERFRINRIIASPLEGRGLVASWNADDETMTVWASTQIPFAQRAFFARAAGLPEHRMRVIVPDVGGAFGQKLNTYREELVCVYLARRSERSVKWVEDRTENFAGGCHARDQLQDVELAARRDGTITALRFRILADLGAFLQTQTTTVPALTGLLASGAYAVPAVGGEVIGVFTNKTPTDAYRGAGKPEAAFLIERLIDVLARELELDPAEVRRRNFIPDGAFPHRTATGLDYDSGRYVHVLEKALELADYARLRREQARARAEGRLVGVGLSTYIELASFGPSDSCAKLFGMEAPGYESGTIRLLPSGEAIVFSGSTPSGQGHETAWAQVVSDALGIPIDDVELRFGDTDTAPQGVGTFGSRSAVIAGSALKLSAEKIIAKARLLAAHWLEAAEDDLEFRDGRFSVAGVPHIGMTLGEVARASYLGQRFPEGVEPGLEATTFFDPPNFTFPFGAHVAVVEVDRETGAVKILRYVAVDDYGNIINPMLVEGQLHGGLAQGIGQALCEEVRYDASGQLETATYSEYPLPTSETLPSFESALECTPSPVNPLGLKGCGESGATGAPAAIVNAVIDALSPFGVRHIDMPLLPEKVWSAVNRAQGQV